MGKSAKGTFFTILEAEFIYMKVYMIFCNASDPNGQSGYQEEKYGNLGMSQLAQAQISNYMEIDKKKGGKMYVSYIIGVFT